MFDVTPLQRKVTFSERLQPGRREWLGAVFYIFAVFSLLLSAVHFFLPTYSATGVLATITGIVGVVLSIAAYVSEGDSIKNKEFAAKNGLTYSRRARYDGRPGLVFASGIPNTQFFLERFFSRTLPFCEVGNYQFQQAVPRRIYMFGFIRVPLPRRLPHIILCRTLSDGSPSGQLAGVPVMLDKSQRLSLEGDFDKYFTLYAPADYKRDALYIFTPDVMAAFIDNVTAYDAEIIDDSLYIYRSTQFDFGQVKDFGEIMRVTAAINEKITSQTTRYADENVADRSLNQVAEPGRKLKHGKWVAGIVFLVVAAALYFYQLLQ